MTRGDDLVPFCTQQLKWFLTAAGCSMIWKSLASLSWCPAPPSATGPSSWRTVRTADDALAPSDCQGSARQGFRYQSLPRLLPGNAVHDEVGNLC
jgi:hypothetical protein